MKNEELKTLIQKVKEEHAYDEQELLEEILKAQERIEHKNEEIQELTFERNLIVENFLDIINKKLRCSTFNIFWYYKPGAVENAWRWFEEKSDFDKKLKNGELSKSEYEEYKLSYEIVVNIVKREFFGDFQDSVKLVSIVQHWTYGYDFVFTYKDQKIMLFIPLFNVDGTTWYDTLSGYKAYYHTDNEYTYTNFICSSLDFKEVANKLQDWLLNERWKENETKGE